MAFLPSGPGNIAESLGNIAESLGNTPGQGVSGTLLEAVDMQFHSFSSMYGGRFVVGLVTSLLPSKKVLGVNGFLKCLGANSHSLNLTLLSETADGSNNSWIYDNRTRTDGLT
jgi:hypothetical protein